MKIWATLALIAALAAAALPGVGARAQDIFDPIERVEEAQTGFDQFSPKKFGLEFCKDLMRNPNNLFDWLDPAFLSDSLPMAAGEGEMKWRESLLDLEEQTQAGIEAYRNAFAEGLRYRSCGLHDELPLDCGEFAEALKEGYREAVGAIDEDAAKNLNFSTLQNALKNAVECGVGIVRTKSSTEGREKEEEWRVVAVRRTNDWRVLSPFTVLPETVLQRIEKLAEEKKEGEGGK